jgi:lysine-specific demethylase 8
VDRADALSPAEFREKYEQPGKPVLITNGLAWAAFEHWTHEWFKQSFGDIDIELSVNPTHTLKVVKMKLGVYIDRILSDKGMSGGLYLDQFPLDRIPSLRKDFDFPPYCKLGREIRPHLWIGPGTTVLSFHKDNHSPVVPIDNIFVQIRGKKRIILASPEDDAFMYPRSAEEGASWHSQVNPEAPDFSQFPLFANALLQEAVLGPGDILYIPRDYWHYVRALEPSISMSFWWIPFRLSEIWSKISLLSDPEFEKMRITDRLKIDSSDLVEFGGVARLAAVFGEMKGSLAGAIPWDRLMSVSDDVARATFESLLAQQI